jgi:hypothetical protein
MLSFFSKMEEFENYLKKKNINSVAFQQAEPELFASFEALFGQVSPESFTAQKLYLLNQIRRKYQLVKYEKK